MTRRANNEKIGRYFTCEFDDNAHRVSYQYMGLDFQVALFGNRARAGPPNETSVPLLRWPRGLPR
jgi:hypothetical protein